jgi:hypothetical protein
MPFSPKVISKIKPKIAAKENSAETNRTRLDIYLYIRIQNTLTDNTELLRSALLAVDKRALNRL